MTDASSGGDGPKRFRSPPYPALNLSKAIDRAKQLYAKALHHAVGANVLAEAWEYGIKSSGLTTTTAALGQYDLLFAAGSGEKRKYQLTDQAIRIIRDADPASEKRILAIRRAALQPPIHRELWAKFLTAANVHDVVLRNYLTLDRADDGNSPFSDAAAEEVIRTYKETIAFAGIGDSDTVSGADEDKGGGEEEPPTPKPELDIVVKWPNANPPPPPPPPPAPNERQEIKLMSGERELTTGLLSKGANFRLIVSGPVGVKEIERLIAKLELDKEILAETDDQGEGEE